MIPSGRGEVPCSNLAQLTFGERSQVARKPGSAVGNDGSTVSFGVTEATEWDAVVNRGLVDVGGIEGVMTMQYARLTPAVFAYPPVQLEDCFSDCLPFRTLHVFQPPGLIRTDWLHP